MSAAARSPNGVRGAGMSRTSTGSIEGAAIFGHAARALDVQVLAHSETATADRESARSRRFCVGEIALPHVK